MVRKKTKRGPGKTWNDWNADFNLQKSLFEKTQGRQRRSGVGGKGVSEKEKKPARKSRLFNRGRRVRGRRLGGTGQERMRGPRKGAPSKRVADWVGPSPRLGKGLRGEEGKPSGGGARKKDETGEGNSQRPGPYKEHPRKSPPGNFWVEKQ